MRNHVVHIPKSKLFSFPQSAILQLQKSFETEMDREQLKTPLGCVAFT